MTRKKNTRREWTKEDDALLLEYAGEMTYRELGEQLGRTINAVATRIQHLRREGEPIPDKRIHGPGRPRKVDDTDPPQDSEWLSEEARKLRTAMREAKAETSLLLAPNGNGVNGRSPEPPLPTESDRVQSIMAFVKTAICNGWRVVIPDMGVTIN